MNFGPKNLGPEGVALQDREYRGSRFSEVWAALLANRYYRTWGTPGDPPLPVYNVTLGPVLRNLFPWPKDWGFSKPRIVPSIRRPICDGDQTAKAFAGIQTGFV